jgi:hypothetical protein
MHFSSKSSALRVIGAQICVATNVYSILWLFNDAGYTESIQRWILMMINECGVVCGKRTGRGNSSNLEKKGPVPIFLLQVPHNSI